MLLALKLDQIVRDSLSNCHIKLSEGDIIMQIQIVSIHDVNIASWWAHSVAFAIKSKGGHTIAMYF